MSAFSWLMVLIPLASAGDPAAVQAELDAEEGWTLHAQHSESGITVYSKPIVAAGVLGFKGIKTLAPGVTSDALLTLITDVGKHDDFNDALEDSVVFHQEGETTEYYQVLKPPPLVPVSARFWLSRGEALRDIDGVEGHHKRIWNSLSPDARPEVRAELSERYPKAMELVSTHGSWEMIPAGDGTTTLVYRSVGDPGGAVPPAMVALMSGRLLPSTMVSFESAALQQRD